jgi:hypothetical protein
MTKKKVAKKKTAKKTAARKSSTRAKKSTTPKKKARTKKEGNVISVNTDETKLEEVSSKLKAYLEPIEARLNSSVLNIDSHLIEYPSTYVFNNASSLMKVSDEGVNSAKFQKSDGFRQIVIVEKISEELFNKLNDCEQEEVGSLLNLTIIPMIESLYANAGHDHNKYTVGYYFGRFKSIDSDNYIEKLSDGSGYKITLSSFCSPLSQVNK